MTTLHEFARHCRTMSDADHLPASDRELFARMAAEVDDYLTPPPAPVGRDLFGGISLEPSAP